MKFSDLCVVRVCVCMCVCVCRQDNSHWQGAEDRGLSGG